MGSTTMGLGWSFWLSRLSFSVLSPVSRPEKVSRDDRLPSCGALSAQSGLTLDGSTVGIVSELSMGRTMDPRYIISAFAGVLAVVIIFATIATVRYISHEPVSPSLARTG